jgi:hypothetical protein
MKIAIAVVLVAAVACGCATLAPPSREQPPLAKALSENARLKESLDAEVQVNHRLAYELEISRINLEKAQAALEAKDAKPAATVPAFQDYEVDHIRLGMLTGPADWTRTGAYDGVAAYLLPLDSDDDVLKRKGNCAFELLDVTRNDGKVIMTWAVPAEVLGSYWQSVPPGYRVKLPWQGDVPYGDDVVVRATFTDAFGRTFVTSKLFHLDKPPAAATPKETTDKEAPK